MEYAHDLQYTHSGRMYAFPMYWTITEYTIMYTHCRANYSIVKDFNDEYYMWNANDTKRCNGDINHWKQVSDCDDCLFSGCRAEWRMAKSVGCVSRESDIRWMWPVASSRYVIFIVTMVDLNFRDDEDVHNSLSLSPSCWACHDNTLLFFFPVMWASMAKNNSSYISNSL